jgi:hypothetical protein
LVLAAALSRREPSGTVFFTAWIVFVALTLGLIVQLGFIDAWKTAVRAGTGWVTLLPGTAAMVTFAAVIDLHAEAGGALRFAGVRHRVGRLAGDQFRLGAGPQAHYP